MREGEMIYTLLGPEKSRFLFEALDSLNEQHLQSDVVSIKHELAQCMGTAPWLLPLLAAAAHAAGSVDHMGQHCENFFSQFDYLFRFNMEAQKHIGSIAMQSVENFGINESEFKELVEEGKLSAFDNPWPPSRKVD
jgi:hypothetical protein